MTTCHQNGRSLRPSSRSRASRRPPTRRTRGIIEAGSLLCVIAGLRTVERSWGPWHRSRLIAFAVTQSPEPPVCRRGSDKRRQMNRSEIPSFVCVSRRVSLPFNLGALNQSKDRLAHTLGRAMRCQSFSIAHRIIDRNPALSRDSVGGICDHHGRTQRHECHIVRHP